jgi:hypothetical protein
MRNSAAISPRRGPPRLGIAVACLLIAPLAEAADVDFDRDVRPLLAAHCTACHGGVKKAGGISFLAREQAVVAGDSGAEAIVPGDPAASELLRRVTSSDESERMPPPEHGRALTPAEVATLRAWIEGGAGWKPHWSFEPPRDPPLPSVPDAAWPRLPLDAFVAARLAAEGLEPAPAARPSAWLRRVSLDLTGLPPSVAEFEAFVADGGAADPQAAAAARERVVDRLLASPRFGERWASVWLDLARYADTFGFEKDPTRTIWPWRDWVIRSFNDDLPFDQFTIRQLAGDLLPEATTDDLLATAFHRNTQTNTEGGTDDEEFRTAAVIDRVNTTWTTWQATTFGCVQCHDHPYDPYAHDDYYRFLAYFDGTLDCDLNDEFPTLPVPGDEAGRAEVAAMLRRVEELRGRQHRRGLAVAAAVTDWRPVHTPAATATGGTLAVTGPGRLEAGGTLPVGVRFDLDLELPPGTTAIRLAIDLDGGGVEAAPPERGAVVSFVELTLPPAAGGEAPASDAKSEPVRLAIADVVPDLIDGPFDARASLDKNPDGFGGYPVLDRPRWCVFVLDDPAAVPADGRVRLAITQSAAANVGTQACPLRHFRLSASSDRRWRDLVESDAARGERRAVREARGALAEADGPRVPVLLGQRPESRRRTHVFTRGNRLEPGATVMPAIPASVGPPAAMSADRLGMARWLVGESNPLAARVLANRLWAEMLGSGIVETLEDFGSSGARPTHPDLLDHLAVRLVREHRWSVKRFLKEVALSATYGQSAVASAEMVARDPRNRLLARGPRSRLTAEMVRDQALAWSGRLSATMGGPPVFPPQPEGIWKTVYSGATWQTSAGEDRFRRSIYTFVKRTAGYPAWLAFDAPSRDACAARRFPTNTPLQPLATLNDPMMIELAAGLAERMAAAGATPRDRIAHGCRLVTLDAPPDTMIEPLLALHAAAQAAADTPGEPAADPQRHDLGPLTVVATALLNLDMVFVR